MKRRYGYFLIHSAHIQINTHWAVAVVPVVATVVFRVLPAGGGQFCTEKMVTGSADHCRDAQPGSVWHASKQSVQVDCALNTAVLVDGGGWMVLPFAKNAWHMWAPLMGIGLSHTLALLSTCDGGNTCVRAQMVSTLQPHGIDAASTHTYHWQGAPLGVMACRHGLAYAIAGIAGAGDHVNHHSGFVKVIAQRCVTGVSTMQAVSAPGRPFFAGVLSMSAVWMTSECTIAHATSTLTSRVAHANRPMPCRLRCEHCKPLEY